MLLNNSKLKLIRTIGCLYDCNNCKQNITSNEIGICSLCANLFETKKIDLEYDKITTSIPYIKKRYNEFVKKNKNFK